MIWHAKSLIVRLFFPFISYLYSTIGDIPIMMCIKTFKSLISAPSPTACVGNGRLTNFTLLFEQLLRTYVKKIHNAWETDEAVFDRYTNLSVVIWSC